MLYCPTCRSNIDSAPDLAGQLVACPFCAQQFYMPPLATEPASLAIVTRGRVRGRSSGKQIASMLAAIISLFIPGLGQLCQGRMLAGVAFLGCWGVSLLALFPLREFALPFVLVFWLWSVVDAALN